MMFGDFQPDAGNNSELRIDKPRLEMGAARSHALGSVDSEIARNLA